MTDTVVAVTGATAGVGRATARLLVEQGARVALLGRRLERLDELVAELGEDRVAVVAGDVADPAVSTRLVGAARERFGRLDSLVAGTGAYGGIMSLTDDAIREIDATNFLVIVSSVAGLRGGPWEGVYAGAKHAQIGLAGSLDPELREHGIRVTAICPAAVWTEFAIGAGRTEGDAWLKDVLTTEDVAATIVATLAQPRRLRTQQWVLRAMAEES